MTQKEAQVRNWKIMRLRGILPRLRDLIPEDIAKNFQLHDMFLDQANVLLELLDKAKRKKYICSNCTDTHKLRKAKSKNAFICDYCSRWTDDLYVVKKKKGI